MPLVRIDGTKICDWNSFHRMFKSAFGFPDFYGENLNAWIDCMTSLDAPEDGMTLIRGSTSNPVILQLDNANCVPKEIFDALAECTAFVNWRRLDTGAPAILILSCNRAG